MRSRTPSRTPWLFAIALAVALAALAPLASRADAPYRASDELLTTRTTVMGEPIQYPDGTAEVKTMIITLRPGEETARHVHPVPLVGYMLEGELTVDYGERGKRTYRAGDALVEAMTIPHQGKATGSKPARILAVFLGAVGKQGTAPAR